MEDFTPKEKQFIDLVNKGMNKTDAVLEVYNTDSKRNASVISANLMKKPRIRKELASREEIKKEIIKDEGRKITEILENIFPKKERAEILVSIARSGDTRAKLQALQEINRLEGEYPKDEYGQQLEGQNFQIVMVKGEETKQLEPRNIITSKPITQEEPEAPEDPANKAIEIEE